MAGLPMIGALMGMCLGGPVGILAGVKIGGLAAVGNVTIKPAWAKLR